MKAHDIASLKRLLFRHIRSPLGAVGLIGFKQEPTSPPPRGSPSKEHGAKPVFGGLATVRTAAEQVDTFIRAGGSLGLDRRGYAGHATSTWMKVPEGPAPLMWMNLSMAIIS
jgi:hypothetical protein